MDDLYYSFEETVPEYTGDIDVTGNASATVCVCVCVCVCARARSFLCFRSSLSLHLLGPKTFVSLAVTRYLPHMNEFMIQSPIIRRITQTVVFV